MHAIPSSYEEKRAQVLLNHIREHAYDYVLDIHISTSDVGRFFLAADMDAVVEKIIGASNITRVAMMPQHIAARSLIGNVSQAISVEYNRDLARTRGALDELVMLLDNLSQGVALSLKRELYYVDNIIPLDVQLGQDVTNFKKTAHNFYPILLGEEAYKTTMQGFQATTYNERIL